MKILFIASEAAPLAKVGGLADVAGALPKALNTLGHDARIMIPQYSNIPDQFDLKSEIHDYEINFFGQPQIIALNQTQVANLPVYTLENQVYFGTQEVYVNDLERFYFFSRAVFEILPRLKWQPDIIHCHDWMTALLIVWAKKAAYPYRSVFTIHNMNFQGDFKEHWTIRPELKADWDFCPPGAPRPPACFMAQAILWADQINTVSETYAREITTPEYGVGLDSLLRFRQDNLCGILNGIDYDVWNPHGDSYLKQQYDSSSLSLKGVNKAELQKEMGLPIKKAIPLVGMVARLDEQKGLDIFLEGIDSFLNQSPVQIVVLGRGRADYQEKLQQLAEHYPKQFAATIAFGEAVAHRIYGGSDLFLMPSRFEPCGLGQMIAMRYGTIPVVRHTGGLVDSVEEFNAELTEGSGFVFHDYTQAALFSTLSKALESYNNRKQWTAAVERVSRLDFSWNVSAKKYEEIYQKIVGPNHKTQETITK